MREYGTQRKAGWWVLGPGRTDRWPRSDPSRATTRSPSSSATTRAPASSTRCCGISTWSPASAAGTSTTRSTGPGLSPFASLKSLTAAQREDLLAAIRSVLDEALAKERTRRGALSEAKLGDRFLVHNRHGEPCPRCGEPLHRVSFDSHEVVYCTHCQTKGKVLADRRMSKLLR